jgi:hypothetical protein
MTNQSRRRLLEALAADTAASHSRSILPRLRQLSAQEKVRFTNKHTPGRCARPPTMLCATHRVSTWAPSQNSL